MKDVKVFEQRATEYGPVVRSLALLDAEGKTLGGLTFAPSDALYDFPLWIEQLVAENKRMRNKSK